MLMYKHVTARPTDVEALPSGCRVEQRLRTPSWPRNAREPKLYVESPGGRTEAMLHEMPGFESPTSASVGGEDIYLLRIFGRNPAAAVPNHLSS